jgi:hypothetical protein
VRAKKKGYLKLGLCPEFLRLLQAEPIDCEEDKSRIDWGDSANE